MLEDQMPSKVSLDRILLFSIRPPELLAIDKVEWHFKCFERSLFSVIGQLTPSQALVTLGLVESAFLDSLEHQGRARPKVIPIIGEFLKQRDFGDGLV